MKLASQAPGISFVTFLLGFRVSGTRVIVAFALWGYLAGPCLAAGSVPEYNRDIRPILAENCFPCHGPDSAARKADLRLDKRESAVELGAITPGDPSASELVTRINATNSKEVMPPPSIHKTLTAAQKDLLKRWIESGAEYQLHWSLIAPVRAAPPKVKNESWIRNPIDRFVLARLEAQGLSPATKADRRTLARRLSLDLTGLPPSPQDVEAFVADTDPDAYGKLVDRLLESPRWGEHRARYWLDAARYADTHGYHFDNYREMWSYRDWVIDAFNRNLPFDRFTLEQLAGDLLPDRTLDQQIASGFNRCNMTTNEGGTIPEENLVNYTRDRTETVSQVWLGLTAGCAVCHDHKFDPLSQREFYELAAFFNNSTQGALDGNIKDTPPFVFVPDSADRPRWSTLPGELAAVQKQIEARADAARPEFDKWFQTQSRDTLASLIPSRNLRLNVEVSPRGDEAALPRTAFESADSGDFERKDAFSFGAWIKSPKAGLFGSVLARMDDQHDDRGWDLWIENNKVAMHLVNKWPENAIKAVTRDEIPIKTWTHVFITYDGSSQAAGVKIYINGEPQPTDIAANQLNDTIRTAVPFKIGQRHTSSRLDDVGISDVRVYRQILSPAEVAELVGAGRALALASKPAEKRSREELGAVLGWWLKTRDPGSKDLQARRQTLEQEQAAIRSRGTVAHVVQERNEPAMAFVLYRGEYDKRRDPVKPDTPDVLPPLPGDLPRNRLGFARWLLRPEHPLTARVSVNRFWQEVFGTGLVRTTGDLGVSGELPSHPELLDWLAVEFRESGWDIKRFFKLLVTSATYRQAATMTPEKAEKDPHNRWLSRGPRFRMDAEMIRDYALAASGLLVGKIGGPSVKPYQPDGVWEAVAMPESNTKSYRRDQGENLYRRSLYTFWKRSAPPASLDVLNAPNREVCTVRRERTNTPLQALVTLNDPQFIEAARGLAQAALLHSGDSSEKCIAEISQRLLARPLRPDELRVVQASIERLSKFYQSHPADASKLLAVGELKTISQVEPAPLAAWTMLANELMNLDEALNK